MRPLRDVKVCHLRKTTLDKLELESRMMGNYLAVKSLPIVCLSPGLCMVPGEPVMASQVTHPTLHNEMLVG